MNKMWLSSLENCKKLLFSNGIFNERTLNILFTPHINKNKLTVYLLQAFSISWLQYVIYLQSI